LLTGLVHSYVEPRNIENLFIAVTMECDISDVIFHFLRYTFATRCVELSFDVESLDEILGHASMNSTMNRYAHSPMELKPNI
jgi:integrase